MPILGDNLRDIACPECNGMLRAGQSDSGKHTSDRGWVQWHRRCERCGIAFSNAQRNPVKIYRSPEHNVPTQVHSRLAETLAGSLNETNRANKSEKFGYETSEDALTWTVFSYLLSERRLGTALDALLPGFWPSELPVALLLWGAPVEDNAAGSEIRERLILISDALDEEQRQRSEPDVLAVASDGTVAIVEVKYGSANDCKLKTYKGWDRGYTNSPAFDAPSRARNSGHYELARNWRIGWTLADRHPFALVNLGLPKLFRSGEGKRLAEFEASLAVSDKRRFVKATWEDFLAKLGDLPPWMRDWLDGRRTQLGPGDDRA